MATCQQLNTKETLKVSTYKKTECHRFKYAALIKSKTDGQTVVCEWTSFIFVRVSNIQVGLVPDQTSSRTKEPNV